MTDFDISSLISVPILALCFVLGYVIKNYTKAPNKFIPLIMVVVGAVASVVISVLDNGIMDGAIGTSIITGAVSGLASTGSYEFIVNTFGLKTKKNDAVEEDSTEDESEETLVEDDSSDDEN